MAALAGTLGGLDIAQQLRHLGQAQPPVRLDGGLAGNIGQHALLGIQYFAQMMAALGIYRHAQHALEQRSGGLGREDGRRGAQAQGSSGGSEQDHFMACLTESEAMQQVFFTFIVLICSLLGAYAYAALQRRVVMRAA